MVTLRIGNSCFMSGNVAGGHRRAVAQTTATAPATTSRGAQTAGAPRMAPPRTSGGGFVFMLHKLDLTAEQKTQVKASSPGEKSQYESLHASSKANRTALSTTPPTDPGYPALVETAKSQCGDPHQASERDLDGDLQQRAHQTAAGSDPGIVAAAQQAREERVAAWKAAHPQATAPTAE